MNLLFRLVRKPFATAMIARAMPAAISPYSIAVAPEASVQNFQRNRFNMIVSSV